MQILITNDKTELLVFQYNKWTEKTTDVGKNWKKNQLRIFNWLIFNNFYKYNNYDFFCIPFDVIIMWNYCFYFLKVK